MHRFSPRHSLNDDDVGRVLRGFSGLLALIHDCLTLSLTEEPLAIFLNQHEDVLKLANNDWTIFLLDYGMCANLHLLKMMQCKTVVRTVRFLAVDPFAEEGIKLMLRFYPATSVLIVEGLPQIIAQRDSLTPNPGFFPTYPVRSRTTN